MLVKVSKLYINLFSLFALITYITHCLIISHEFMHFAINSNSRFGKYGYKFYYLIRAFACCFI